METSLAAVISLVMSLTGPLVLFFMIPLQALAVRRGERAFIYSASGVFAGNLFLKMIPSSGTEITGSLFVADSAIFIFLLLGLYVVNFRLKSFRTVLRMLLTTAAVAIVSIPVLIYLNSDQSFNALMIGQIDSVMVVLKEATPGNTVLNALDPQGLYNLFRDSFLGSFLAVYFFLTALTWRLGSRLGNKSMGQVEKHFRLQEFNVPDRLVWFLFIPLTIVLLRLLFSARGLSLELGLVDIAVSNSLYIMGVLFGLQGFGLLQFLMERRNLNPGFRRMLGWLIVLSLFIFPLNLLVFLLLPGMGVSELWINYRHNDKEMVQ